MKVKTSPFDAADYLKSEEAIAAYMDSVLEDGTPQEIARALGTVARARGMGEIAEEAGMSRTSLYKSLSENGNPSVDTLLKVIRSLGLQLHVKPADNHTVAS